MTVKNILECEKKSFRNQMKGLKLLPHAYFKIGVILTLTSILILIALKIIGDYELVKEVVKNAMLLSVLLMVVSKDKEEDEMTLKIRSQAFVFAFIWGVVYAAAQPFINIIAELIMESEGGGWSPLSVYQVLFFMLMIQLSFYHVAKRMR